MSEEPTFDFLCDCAEEANVTVELHAHDGRLTLLAVECEGNRRGADIDACGGIERAAAALLAKAVA